MRRRVLIGILLLPLLFVLLSPVYSFAEDDYSTDDDSEMLDELEQLLEGDFNLDDNFDDNDDDFDEIDDILQEKSLNSAADVAGDNIDEDDDIDLDRYIKMIEVKGGCYKMGDNFGSGHYDERPTHRVCVDDFTIAETELTQELYEKINGFNPSFNVNPTNPVEFVSWDDVGNFIEALNEKTDRHFRLPTEAEWEYAARGQGKLEEWPGTNDEDDLIEYAWFDFTSLDKTHPVKQKEPNLLGIYDMAGNVWEWVYDHYDMGYYSKSPSSNPEGPDFSVWRGLRGGSFADDPRKIRASGRYGSIPPRRTSGVGFRLAE